MTIEGYGGGGGRILVNDLKVEMFPVYLSTNHVVVITSFICYITIC
jgi:hypothetical protein